MKSDLTANDLREVIERAKSHDPDAWEILYRHSYQRLVAYARRRLPSADAAEDAVSEAMVRAVRQLEGFTWRRSGFDGWMYGILRNVVLERQRMPRQADKLAERYSRDPTRQQLHRQGNPEDHLDRLIDNTSLRQAFAQLAHEDQEILELRIVGELSAADVGVVVGKSAGAVRMAQSRALERLRAVMKEVDGA